MNEFDKIWNETMGCGACDVKPSEDCVRREDVDAYIAKLMSGYLYDEERTRLEEFSAYLWELPSVTPRTNLAETSQDCISIEPIQWYSQNKDGYLVKGAYSKDEAYVKLTDVYEKIRISEDCISREEVQDLISRWLSDYLLDETREALETINYKVGNMPAVYPERPKGKWIEVLEWRTEFSSAWHYECSECRARSYKGYKPLERYCPKCGAEMSGGGEDEVSD